MYPNAAEDAALERTTVAHCKVSNTLLETSRLRHYAGLPAYNRTSVNEATRAIRNALDWVAERTTAQSLQVTGERLVRAFDGFFRRVAAGQTPGYPRFKSAARYPGFGFKDHGDGWKLLQGSTHHREAGRTWHSYSAVRLTGIGTIGLRGQARFAGVPKTAEVLRKGGKWYLSVTFDVTPEAIAREGGTESMAFDWGLATLLTQVIGDPMTGAVEKLENPRWLKCKLKQIADVQRDISALEALAKKRSGLDKRFPVDFQLKCAYARRRALHAKVARQRGDFYHQLSARLVARFGLIVTEELNVASMTAAPAPIPNPNAPGEYLPNGAANKARLNRSILDAAPAGFIAKLRSKAEEAGTKFLLVPTRTLKPTQRCHVCGATTKLTLKDRSWRCACGAQHDDRDVNAARTMLRYAFEGRWWKTQSGAGTVPVALARPETPSELVRVE